MGLILSSLALALSVWSVLLLSGSSMIYRIIYPYALLTSWLFGWWWIWVIPEQNSGMFQSGRKRLLRRVHQRPVAGLHGKQHGDYQPWVFGMAIAVYHLRPDGKLVSGHWINSYIQHWEPAVGLTNARMVDLAMAAVGVDDSASFAPSFPSGGFNFRTTGPTVVKK